MESLKSDVKGETVTKNIKGASDFLPDVQIVRNRLTDVLRRNFEKFGFLPLETAMLNYYDLLSYKYSPDAEILREIYKLKDQGDRDLGLRFDLTVPFCKVIAMNRNLRLPFKRYEIGKVFRNGPVKFGRAREFYQCDVDCVGVSGAHIEAELILLCTKIMLSIGITPVIKIGNRKILADIINNPNIEAIIAILDNAEKAGQSETYKSLEKYGAQKLLDLKIEPNAELKELFALLDKMGIAKYCEFSPLLTRGLNIYTGTVWEVYDKAGRINSAIGGGGRYDNIIGNFIGNGQKYPAVGMSFGLEPISAILAGQQSAEYSNRLMIIPFTGAETAAQMFAETLRADGSQVLVNLSGKNVGKCFEYANAEKIPFAAVMGENEISTGQISIKKMSTGEQKTFKIAEIKKIMEFIKNGN